MSDFRTVRGLTPTEVTECIIRGIPLQYQTDSSDKWVDLHANPNHVSFYAPYTYRKKPTTTTINGVEVPLPDLDYGASTHVYTPDLCTGGVITVPTEQGFIRSKTMFWNKREDAQAVLDAILKPLTFK